MDDLHDTVLQAPTAVPAREHTHARRAELERRLVIAEYLVMAFKRTPGLRLTASTAAQLLGCEEYVAARTLGALAEAHFLACLEDGAFKRA
jgi:hypothetical protein